jgi:hypothetical protein
MNFHPFYFRLIARVKTPILGEMKGRGQALIIKSFQDAPVAGMLLPPLLACKLTTFEEEARIYE